jgi:hypothetical protein
MRVYQFRHVGLKATPCKGYGTSDEPNNTCNTDCGQLEITDNPMAVNPSEITASFAW